MLDRPEPVLPLDHFAALDLEIAALLRALPEGPQSADEVFTLPRRRVWQAVHARIRDEHPRYGT